MRTERNYNTAVLPICTVNEFLMKITVLGLLKYAVLNYIVLC